MPNMGAEKNIGHFSGVEKTQNEFNDYINGLSDQASCKYMEDVHGIVSLCNCHFNCKFQAKVSFQFRMKAKHECKREHYMKLKKLL
jgi:hypothetical protein